MKYIITHGSSSDVDIERHVNGAHSDHVRYGFALDYYRTRKEYEEADCVRDYVNRYFDVEINLKDLIISDKNEPSLNNNEVRYPDLCIPDKYEQQVERSRAVYLIAHAFNQMRL